MTLRHVGRGVFAVALVLTCFAHGATAQTRDTGSGPAQAGHGAADTRLKIAQAAGVERRLSRTERQQIQAALNSRGFAVGQPDGVFGRNTRIGIARYQQSIGAPPTGELTGDQVSDLLNRRTQAARSEGVDTPGFTIAREVDLPGNDIAGPRTDPRLSNTTWQECAAVCAGTTGCNAFTFNTQARGCFLKSAAGPPIRFRGAVSGMRRSADSGGNADTVVAGSSSFRLLEGTDLPGNDIATPQSDPRLGNVSLNQCQALCLANGACQSFTYNRAAGACFLKGPAGQGAPFRDAVSGVRAGEATAVAGDAPRSNESPVGPSEAAYRAGESDADAVARIREAAVRFGGDCDAEKASIRRLHESVAVTTSATELDAGERLSIDWSVAVRSDRKASEDPVPAYLMLAVDGPVRFEGDGFYVLMPGARAAFGIERFADRTRVVVPLQDVVPGSRGQVVLRPLLAGSLALEWAVAGYLRRCQDEVVEEADGKQLRVTIPGSPTIVLRNDADLSSPDTVVDAPRGARIQNRKIEVYDGRFRVIDTETETEIAERAGTDPQFSPTGRFAVAQSDDGIEILDSVDGALLHKDTRGGQLVWSDHDSFLVIERPGRGIATVLAPVQGGRQDPEIMTPAVGGRTVFQVATGCRVCGAREAGIRIDRENDVVFIFGSQGGGAARLSFSGNKYDSGWTGSEEVRNRALAFVRSSQLADFSWPQTWELGRGAPGVQDGTGEPAPVDGNATGDAGVDDRQPPPGGGDGELERVAWRGLSRLPSETGSDDGRVLRRMDEFGFDLTRPAASSDDPSGAGDAFDLELSVMSDDGEGAPFSDSEARAMRAVADRIRSEVPAARGTIVAKPADAVRCDVAESDWDDRTKTHTVLKIFDQFQRAFRLESDGRTVWITHHRCVDGSAAISYPTTALFDSARPEPWFLDAETGDPEADFSGSMGVCFIDIADCDFEAGIVQDRFLMLWSRASRAIEIYDLDERRNLFRKYNLPRGDVLRSVAMTGDGRGVVQINEDGTFFLYSVNDGEVLLSGRYVDDEIVVWTPDMRFDSTAEGAHFVNLKFPGQPGEYTFQQFDRRLRIAGLVDQLLSGDLTSDPVDIGVPPRLTGSVEAGEDGRLTGRARLDSSGDASAIQVYQDGVLTDDIPVDGAGEPVAIDVPRLPGARWVSLLGIDREGLASLPKGRDLGPDFGRRATVHLLSVGVDEYDSGDIADLGLAVRDAETLVDSVTVANPATLDVGDPTLLLNADASPGAILDAAGDIVANAVAGDTVVFFFAGHGVKDADGRFYLATSGSDPADLASTALAWDDLAAVLARSKARVAVFLDACHSGLAGTDFFATNDDAASGILKNIPSGLVVFSAAKGREVSREVPELGGGVFTQAVADVIARDRGRHDTNENGAIEVSELYSGVKRKVVNQTEGRQTPWLARNQMVGDFALF